jgi:site-specific DNA-methyltransferase (adenine-specific)
MQLYQGDCLEVMKNIPDKSVDMILCDLPYGTTACSWDTIIPFDKLWEQYNRVIKDNGAICLFGSEPFASNLRLSKFDLYKYDWYWEKERGTGFARANKQPLRKIENICVFYKKQPFYNSVGKKLDKPYKHALPIVKSNSDNVANSNLDNGERMYSSYEYSKKHNLLRFARKTKGSLHPTQKPVALMEYLIETYTNVGETVLDNCMGSGTTGVACKHLNRNFIGIELDPNYFEIAKNRIENEQTQLTLTEQKD